MAELKQADWEPLPDASASIAAIMRRGIFMDIVGVEGGGKSSLALTLAQIGKVAYVDIDQSVDRAKKPDGKKVSDNIKILPIRYSVGLGMSEERVKAVCGPVWANLGTKMESATASWARGAVVDTGTEGWELCRLASTGTPTPRGRRMDRVWGPINARMRQLLRTVYRTNCKHLITIHQLTDEYVDKMKEGEMQSIRTGKKVRKGFKEIGYLCDLVVRCERESGTFKAVIDLCKLPPFGPDIEGMELEGDQMDFRTIVALATGTEPKEWK